MLPRRILLVSLGIGASLLPITSLAIQRSEQTQTIVQPSPQIYVLPQQLQKERQQSQNGQQEHYQQRTQKNQQYQYQKPTPMQQESRTYQTNNEQAQLPMNITAQSNDQQALKQNPQAKVEKSKQQPFTKAEKKAWFESCLKAVTNKKVVSYAQEFCQCGWQRILNGPLSPKALTSNNPKLAQKQKGFFVAITQECMVKIVSKHHLL